MAEDKVKVLGSSIDGTQGTLTLQVPAELFRAVAEAAPSETFLPMGESVARDLGSRYGLRTDSQSLTTPTTRDEMITLSRDIYISEPVVATVVDLMIDLAMTGMENRGDDPKAKLYFDNVCKYGDFDALHRDIMREYILVGDVFLMRGPRQQVTYGPDKGAAYFKYTVLNPKYVEVTGPLLFDSEQIGLKTNQELKKFMEDSTLDPKVLRGISPELKKAVQSGTVYFPKAEVMSRISRKRASFERYGVPFLTRVFEPVLIKRRMREADVALAETVRYVLVTITTGNDDYPAKPEDITKLAALFQNPHKSMELFWNHTLKVEFHFPDANLFDDTKYKQVNADIIQGLGIPPVLIDGGGGTFATAWTSLLSVTERLDAIRDTIARWQEKEYLRIAETDRQNFKSIPSVKFNPLNLRDEKSWRALLTELYDRGLLSIETLLNLTDLDMDVEFRNRKAEQKSSIQSVFVPRPKSGGSGGSSSPDPGKKTNQIDQKAAPRDPTGTPTVDNAPADNQPSNTPQ